MQEASLNAKAQFGKRAETDVIPSVPGPGREGQQRVELSRSRRHWGLAAICAELTFSVVVPEERSGSDRALPRVNLIRQLDAIWINSISSLRD